MARARASLCALLLAAAGCRSAPPTGTFELRLPADPACRPSELDQVRVTALGDFAAADDQVGFLDLRSPSTLLSTFPAATEAIAVEAEDVGRWLAGGITRVRGGDMAAPVLLLPLGAPCRLDDPGAGVPPGAALTVTPDGELLVVGGEGDAGGRLAALRLDRDMEARCRVAGVAPELCPPLVGEDGARLDALCAARGLSAATCALLAGDDVFERRDELLLAEREGATLTALGDGSALVVGGDGDRTFERLDVSSEARGLFRVGRLRGVRRDHGAVLLPGGDVLIVGGSERVGGPPLGSAERIPSGSADSVPVAGAPPAPRLSPAALRLDDGTILVLGGVDGEGDPVVAVERYEPAADGFVVARGALPPRVDGPVVALLGARAARVGGRDASGAWSGDVDLVLCGGEEVLTLPALLPPLEAPAAAALLDGRLLVTGRAEGAPAAYLLDLGLPSAEPVPARGVPARLVVLDAGVVAELHPDEVALRRVDLTHPLDQPPASYAPGSAEDRAALALDAGLGRWTLEAGALVATASGARFDVPALRFARLRVDLNASGPVEVLLTVDGAAPLVIRVEDTEVTLGACELPRALGAPVTIVRDADRVELSAAGAAVSCGGLELPARVGVAVRADVVLQAGAPDLARSGAIRQLGVARL